MKFKAYFKYGVVAAWLVMGWSIFRTEARLVAEMPQTMALSPQERKIKVDGPIFTFFDNLRVTAPENSSVYIFFGEVNSVHLRKAAYYLYPRKLNEVREMGDIGEAVNGDYLAVYIPGKQFETETYRAIASNAAFMKIYEKDGGAIFMVSKGQGQ